MKNNDLKALIREFLKTQEITKYPTKPCKFKTFRNTRGSVAFRGRRATNNRNRGFSSAH